MNYASVASGIEAATVAWSQIPGWHPVWFSQYDPDHNYKTGWDFPSKVLAFHYPDIPNLGDMLKLHHTTTYHDKKFDLLVGGTPCQSFSLAGLRTGLDDDRGNLALQFCRILADKKPRWFVWENVPGVFSSFSDETKGSQGEINPAGNKATAKGKTGRPGGSGRTDAGDADTIIQSADFATLLKAFSECGYSVCWRVLDSQFFGVPQRRRRVFVVGYLGADWRPPFAVLFERESLQGYPAPGKKTGQAATGKTSYSPEVAGTILKNHGKRGCTSYQDIQQNLPAVVVQDKSGTLTKSYAKRGGIRNQDIEGYLSTTVMQQVDNGEYWDGSQKTTPIDASMKKGGQSMSEKVRFQAVIQPAPYKIFTYKNKKDGTDLDTKANTIKRTAGNPHDMNSPAYVVQENTPHAFNVTFCDENGTRKDRPEGGMYVNPTDKANTLQSNQDVKTLIVGTPGQQYETPIIIDMTQITQVSNRSNPKDGDPAPTLHSMSRNFTLIAKQVQWASGGGQIENDTAQALRAKAETNYQFVHQEIDALVAPTLTRHNLDSRSPQSQEQQNIVEAVVSATNIVRRLTPLECERLQGFPDYYTLIPTKKVPKSRQQKLIPGEIYFNIDGQLWHSSPDTKRYEALGNSMTTNVMYWIGSRIDKVDKLLKTITKNGNKK